MVAPGALGQLHLGEEVAEVALRLGSQPAEAPTWGRPFNWLGARDLGERLPFLCRSTHLDASALRTALGDRLVDPAGASAEDAVRRLAIAARNGGPDALAARRYRAY